MADGKYYRGKYYPNKSSDSNAPKKRGNPNWRPGWGKKNGAEPGSLYKPLLTPDEYQTAVLEDITGNTDSTGVDAKAGVGKTTVCVEGMHRLPKEVHRDTGYLIYAKRNQEEAVGKCPATLGCVKTSHAFGLRALSQGLGKQLKVDKYKEANIAQALIGPEDEKAEQRYMVERGISLAKDYLAESAEEVIAACDKHGIEMTLGGLRENEFAAKVLEGLEVSKKQPEVVSFADMVWLPLVLGVSIPRFKYLFADECQDLNKARIELVLRASEGGKLIFVGDEAQSIFGFSGADKDALAKLKERSGAKILPLYRTYRCGRAIVEYAKQFVPEYEAGANNPEGEVADVTVNQMMKAESEGGAGPGDFILSRTNAPLFKYALQFLKEGRKANILGNDLGLNLTYMIKRSKAKSVPEFMSWLKDWENAEVERLSAKNKDYTFVTDKVECLESLCEWESNLDIVKFKINELFDKDEDDDTRNANRITLSTIHKAKGLERERVWVLENSFNIRTRTEEDKVQERNIRYVACTRAISSLFLVG